MKLFNQELQRKNDELRTLLGLAPRRKQIYVTYIGDRGSFTACKMDYKEGYELFYMENITYSESNWRQLLNEALNDRPF